MRKRMLSGIRDLWIVLFCLMERTLLQILLAVPVPVRMVLAGVLAAKYVECLFCTSLSMTILTVVMTVFVATQEVERRISDHICDGKNQKVFTKKSI